LGGLLCEIRLFGRFLVYLGSKNERKWMVLRGFGGGFLFLFFFFFFFDILRFCMLEIIFFADFFYDFLVIFLVIFGFFYDFFMIFRDFW
jgi:hypothetical protein